MMWMFLKYGLRERLSHFLAQVYQETGVLRLTEEVASGAEYEGVRRIWGILRKAMGLDLKGVA
jgi:predicted chitinase